MNISNAGDILRTLGAIYRPRYIALNIVAIAAYYFVYTTLVAYQNYGIVLFTGVPIYLIYALVLTSSVLLTIAVYSIKNTIRNAAKTSASVAGSATTLIGGVIGGCGCQASILFGLTQLGLGSSGAFALVDFVSGWQPQLFLVLIVLNLFVIAYYLNKLSSPGCRFAKNKGARRR